MFEGAPKSWKEALQAAENSQAQAFPLKASVSIHIVSHYSQVESPNVAAILPAPIPGLGTNMLSSPPI